MVVDGRQPGWSDGVTRSEAGYWLSLFGAHNGMNLDGGGSSTYVLRNSAGSSVVQNHPSDGSPRPVGANIGVFAPPLPTHTEVYARGANNALMQRSWTQGIGWSGWGNYGGTWVSAPDMCSRGYGTGYEVVMREANKLWKRTWSGTSWSSWLDLGQPAVGLTGDPTAVSYGPGSFDVFCRGGDGALWIKSWLNPGWSAWNSWGGQIKDSPDAISRGRSSIDIFCRGTNDHLLQVSWQAGGGVTWSDLGEVLTSGPAAVSYDSAHVNVFWRGANGYLTTKHWVLGAGWSASAHFTDCAMTADSPPDASSRDSVTLDVFYRGPTGVLRQKSWSAPAGGWQAPPILDGSLTSGPGTTAW